jgi:hypothetical protein
MKKTELESIIEKINQKIESVDILNQKIEKANQIIQEVQTNAETLKNSATEIEKFKGSIEQINNEVAGFKDVIENVHGTSVEYSETVAKQTDEYRELKENFDELTNNNNELSETIKDQLGLVSMEILANSFFEEAGKLKESSHKWFWWLFGSMVALLLSVIGVATWQIIAEDTLFQLSFLIRIPIITPVLYFLIFVAKQYGRDRKLLDEYTFKASVARSFEAYRKLLREEDESAESDKQKIDFIIETIRNIYSSPMNNIRENGEKSKDDEIGLGTLSKITNIIKGLIK